MTNQETIKLALEALKWSVGCMSFDDYDDMPEAMAELEKAHKAIKALEEALAKQEPDYSICPTCGGMADDPIVPLEHRHKLLNDK
jgi:hypothetical protein